MSDHEPQIRISVTPEPTEEELAVILSAVTVLLAGSPPSPIEPTPGPSRWAEAGRREAMRGIGRDDPPAR